MARGGCVLYFLVNGDLFHTAESGCSECVPVFVVNVIFIAELLQPLSLTSFFETTSLFMFEDCVESPISPLRPSVSIRNVGLSTPLSAVVDELGVDL